MPHYNQGKIYSIRSLSRPDLVYIGSTSQSLAKRYGQHKLPSNKVTSSQIIALGDSYIELVEEYKCDNKNQLQRREGEIIRSTDCVNKVIPGRTTTEYRIDNADKYKQYYIDNIDRIKQYRIDNLDKSKETRKKYYIDNADKIKQYYIDNADKIKQYRIDNLDKLKQYQIDNADKIKQYTKQYRSDKKHIQICICGSEFNYANRNKHYASQKHTNYILERQEVAHTNYYSHM